MAAESVESAETPHLSARRLATRERLLDAAAAVFAEEGLQGASVEAICARADFSRGAFYSNFDSKEQLFMALLEREFQRRARYVAEQALAVEPQLRNRDHQFTPEEAARLIADFFVFDTTITGEDAAEWYVLETEFLLLAMRDRTLAPGYRQFVNGFFASLSPVVEQVVAAAGRRFTLPVERAIPVLSGVYERALRNSALSGALSDDTASGGADRDGKTGGLQSLGADLAELLFAITHEHPDA